jgi:acetate kinase
VSGNPDDGPTLRERSAAAGPRILTLNAGSSSLRFSLHRIGGREERLLSGRASGLGGPDAELRVEDGSGRTIEVVPLASAPGSRAAVPVSTPPLRESAGAGAAHRRALEAILDWLAGPASSSCGPGGATPDAVGHRIVHGGERFIEPVRVTPEVLESLEALVPLAPDHLPAELRVLRAATDAYRHVPHVACFDTAFHRSMPARAHRLPLPALPGGRRLVRYGFHGLFYEYLRGRVAELSKPAEIPRRLVLAHLGSGASLAALLEGRPVDTTMGFTPAGGLMMATRPGDLDPGVLLYLLREGGFSVQGLDEMVNRRSGLLGVSGSSPDMRHLLERESEDGAAAAAVELFCYVAMKQLGAMAAAVGGLDGLVFSGGIGENAPAIRARIAAGAAYLGIRLDPERNRRGEPVISASDSAVAVRVIPTDEERVIARHTAALLENV